VKMSMAYYGFRNMTPANYFAAAAALGVTNVEVPMYDHHLSAWFGPHSIQDVRDLAEQCGVEMVSAVAGMELAGPVDEIGRALNDRHVDLFRSLALVLVDISAELGLSVLRITEPNLHPENQHLEEQFTTAYGEALRPIGEYGQSRGITIAVENYGISSKQVDSMLEVADHSNVGTLFDPCNYARMGENPLDAFRLLKDRIVYCHLKDTKDDEDRDHDSLYPGSRWRPSVAVGDGDIDWVPLLSELNASHQGYASIEYEDADTAILGSRRSLDFIAATLRPGSE